MTEAQWVRLELIQTLVRAGRVQVGTVIDEVMAYEEFLAEAGHKESGHVKNGVAEGRGLTPEQWRIVCEAVPEGHWWLFGGEAVRQAAKENERPNGGPMTVEEWEAQYRQHKANMQRSASETLQRSYKNSPVPKSVLRSFNSIPLPEEAE